MKIVLISTHISPHAMNFFHCMDLVNRKFSHIPLHLATIAGGIPNDIEISIIDENVEEVPENLDADVVAFTSILCQKDRTFELADKFRTQGITVAIGGPITDTDKEACLEHADLIFIGEGEYTFPQFIDDFINNVVTRIYHQKEFINMDDTPIPRYDLLKTDRYSAGCLQVTRGCPYRCEYCDVPVRNGGKPRSKPIEKVLEEIRIQAELGFDSIFIVDDHFAGNRPFAKRLLKAIAELLPQLPIKMYFYTQVTLNIAKDDELLELFSQASFRRLFIGIETADIEHLQGLNKKHNAEQDIHAAISKIQGKGITVWAGILFGLDNETNQSYENMLKFIADSGITPVQMGLMQAMPDTPLYNKVNAQKRLRDMPDTMGASGMGDSKSYFSSNIAPNSMSEPERNQLFANTIRKLYEPKAYGDRLIRAESKIENRPMATWPELNKSNLMAVLRTLKYYLVTADLSSK